MMFRMMHPVILILATLCCCFCCGKMAILDHNQRPRAVPCPEEADISPCICTVIDESTFDMEMDCSLVTNNAELARIFSENFPFTDFYSLEIHNNYYLTTIRAGDLGQITFKHIHISSGYLESVEVNAFMHSHDTLTHLQIIDNFLTSFPFNEMSQFNQLETLELDRNQFVGMPVLASSSLRYLSLDGNPISGVGPSSLPSLYNIGLSSTAITYIAPGTFVGLPLLTYVYLYNNYIEVLEEGTINLHTPYNYVNLNGNSLTSIAEGALVGLRGQLLVQYNQLTELAENVFRPLMDVGVGVHALGNPLDCGCEIAWLVLNPLYKGQLMDDTTCVSGELVANLDPDIYEALCN